MSNNIAAWLPFKKARPFQVGDAPMPVPEANQVIIRVRAVAINPADVLVQKLGIVYTDDMYPIVFGCDAAGEIVELGSDVNGLQVGDRVIAGLFKGAFQHYVAATIPFVAKIPDHIEFKDAVVLPLALTTTAVSIFEKDMLALSLPSVPAAAANGKTVLIWGGASAVGSTAVQMASAAGYEVATTASKHNFDFCKSLGASYVFDYKNEEVAQQIVKELQGKDFAGVYNAVNAEGLVGMVAKIAGELGGSKIVATIVPPFMPIKDPIPDGVVVRQCWHSTHHVSTAAQEVFGTWLPAALADGTMKCAPPAEVVGHGLENMQDAVDKLGEGVSAKKIVVTF